MALNFPNNPGIGSVYTDSTSGFSYQWNGTLWQSYSSATAANIQVLDDISGSFNGVTLTFALTSSGAAVSPVNAQQLDINLGGVIQAPGTDYTVSGSNIVFTGPAPTAGLTFSGKLFGSALSLNTIPDGAVTPAKLSAGGPSWNSGGDLNVTGVVTATTFSGTATTANTLSTNATGTNLTLSGNLTVNGTQTIINTQTLDVSDKTVGVASTSTKTALTQDGGGLVIYGPTDINFTYDRNQVAVGLNTNLSVSGVITATSFKGDGSQLSGVGLQLKSSGVSAGTGVTTIDFNGAVVSTTTAGVSTVTISGLSSTGISTAAIWSNPSFILSSIELTQGNNNYGAFGPITVAVGATVTVGIANTWVIV